MIAQCPANRIHFPPDRNFANLTLAELLSARDAWHIPLTNMHNVICTAIGRYRFRDDDEPGLRKRKETSEPRTFSNSRITNDSYACVLVLVDEWLSVGQFGDGDSDLSRTHLIPEFLYTSDGLVAPTCVVKVELAGRTRGVALADLSYPDGMLGGGCPLLIEVQGVERVGTAGCLVTDGERRYVLTARHVAGEAGRDVFSIGRGTRSLIGKASAKRVGDVPMSELFPPLPMGKAMATLDAGLVDIDDADTWTSQIFSLGEIDAPADMNASNISLELLGQALSAYGARSGLMEGEIHGLFPRYRSTAGIDYLADILIGPRTPAATAGAKSAFRIGPGDSGALWSAVSPSREKAQSQKARPVALNWGALDLSDSCGEADFSLATFISSIQKALGIDLITSHNTGFELIWGKANHQAIAQIICKAMERTRNEVSGFLLGQGDSATAMDIYSELAYVPDAWKRMTGRGHEGPNHYADIDLRPDHEVPAASETLADAELTPKVWLAFYERCEDSSSRGAIPFRIAQIAKEMMQFEDPNMFICAAGILMHYVADATNIAHLTKWGRGNPQWLSKERSAFHAVWDNAIYDADIVVDGLVAEMAKPQTSMDPDRIEIEVRDMMASVLNLITLAPYADGPSYAEGIKAARAFTRTEECRAALQTCIMRGSLLWWRIVSWAVGQAGIGQEAWDAETEMRSIYSRPDFLPSLSLEQLAE